MKKLAFIIIAIAMIGFTGQSFAQSIGGKLGLNFANISGDNTDNNEMNMGFAAGVFINIPIVPSLVSLQPEILYSQKGAKIDAEIPYLGTVTTKIWTNYIEIPIMAKVTIPVVPIYAMVGPYIGYALNGKVDIDGTSTSVSGSELEDGGTKRFDYGLNFGLGYEKGFGPINVFIDAL